jgi:hypothetical protein
MLSVFRGRDCVGFLLSRGPKGFEAFDGPRQCLVGEQTDAALVGRNRPEMAAERLSAWTAADWKRDCPKNLRKVA